MLYDTIEKCTKVPKKQSELGMCNLGLTLWNQSSFEFKFDDTRLSSLADTANRAETLQSQDATRSSNGANLIFIIWGKSGIIKIEFKTI